MARLKLIKKIVNNDVINSFNLIMNILFGGKTPEIYDENKIYNKGDSVIVFEDGVYKVYTIIKDNVTGPFNKENASEIVFTDLFKDSSVITQNNTELKNKQEAISDDLATIVYELAGLLDNRLSLRVLYKENFKNDENLNITTGVQQPGLIESVPGIGIDFKLKNPVILTTTPQTFKLKHYMEIVGAPTIGCEITFNALDSNPYWFNANGAILSDSFFDIPLDDFEKEKDVPFALNIRLYGDCTTVSSLKISDLMVVFV